MDRLADTEAEFFARLQVTDFDGDRTIPTWRSGFNVTPDVDLSPCRVILTVLNGYNCINTGELEIIEPTILELYALNVDAPYSRRGYARALITRGLQEGRARGFSTSRVDVENPAVLRILQQLEQAGQISDLHLSDGGLADRRPPEKPSTPMLLRCASMTYDEASDLLIAGQDPEEEESSGYSNQRIYAIFTLT